MTESSRPLDVARSVRIRPARPEDCEFVRSLATHVFSVYGSYDRYLVEWFESEGVATWIAESGGEPIGLMMLIAYPHRSRRTEAVADLLAIAVDPRFQSQGLGTALLERAVAEAPHLPSPLPVRELHLSVAEGNARAQRLFARHGFRITRDEGIYPAGQRALHMVRSLP